MGSYRDPFFGYELGIAPSVERAPVSTYARRNGTTSVTSATVQSRSSQDEQGYYRNARAYESSTITIEAASSRRDSYSYSIIVAASPQSDSCSSRANQYWAAPRPALALEGSLKSLGQAAVLAQRFGHDVYINTSRNGKGNGNRPKDKAPNSTENEREELRNLEEGDEERIAVVNTKAQSAEEKVGEPAHESGCQLGGIIDTEHQLPKGLLKIESSVHGFQVVSEQVV